MDRPRQESGNAVDDWEHSEVAVEELAAELQEKEDLIHALTAQLEQAVEQLDRIHREGGDRGGRSTGNAVAGDFVEEQRYVNDRMNQWLDAWEQQQPFDLFARLEQRLEEIVQRGVSALPAMGGLSGFESPTAELKEPEDSAAAWKRRSGSCWETCRLANRRRLLRPLRLR